MKCPRCGNPVAPGLVACQVCGAPLDPSRSAPAAPSPPAPDSGALEARLKALESRVREVEKRLPRSRILSHSFWTRAFTVLGHDLAALLAIYLVVFGVILAVGAVVALIGIAAG